MKLNRRVFLSLLPLGVITALQTHLPLPLQWKAKLWTKPGWRLDELRWCVDVINQRCGDRITGLACNYTTRRGIVYAFVIEDRQVARVSYVGSTYMLGNIPLEMDNTICDNIVILHGVSGKHYTCNLHVPSVQHGPYTPYHPTFYARRGEFDWPRYQETGVLSRLEPL